MRIRIIVRALSISILVLLFTIIAFPHPPAWAQQAAEDPANKRLEAKKHFDLGVEHSDRAEWDAALAEFLASRSILATTKNTYNAAVSLRKLQRFDEALDMYETFLREFPDASPQEKQVAEKELAQLKASVGTIELKGVPNGAKVVVDGRDRGTVPLPSPLRVGAGRHTVRIVADGYLPFESSIDVAGLATVPLEARLAAMTAAGRLRVTEQSGRVIDVVVDGAVVGHTPWEGVVSPGAHTVLLKGNQAKEPTLGTQPVRPSVTLNQSVTLNLLAEVLDASVHVEPLPTSSTIAIDGVELGRGAWEGRLRAGAHVVTASAEGFLPFKQSFELKKDATEVLAVKLERDPKSALFAAPSPSIVIEGSLALPIGLLVGGDLGDAACGGPCSASVPVGFRGVAHGTYQLGSGLGFGVDVGYLLAFRGIDGRATQITPKGRAPNQGTANDDLRLSALTIGAAAQYHRAVGDWPLTVRLGAGVLLGNTRDARTGDFTNSLGERYAVSLRESAPSTYLYVAPDIRIGRALTKHLEVNVGMEILLMAAIVQPTWRDKSEVLTTNNAAAGQRGDGLGIFGGEQSMLGSALLFVAPGVGLRYEL